MKKITIGLSLLLIAFTGVKAQDYKKVRTSLLLSQADKSSTVKLEQAKDELDKVMADPKAATNAETYLLKAEIMGSIAGEQSLQAKYPGAAYEGLEALKKYLEMEPSEAKLKEDRYAGINTIYTALFSKGQAEYNNKNYNSAFNVFKNVAELGDIFTSRKWSSSAFDTTSYLFAGATAQNAKRNDDAVKYYGAIADHKVGGPDYESIYDFLTKYYLNSNDEANFKKYNALAKELYPGNTLWNDLDFAFLTDNASVDEVEKRYDEAVAANSLNASGYADYAEYFLNNKKVKDLDSAKKMDLINKSFEAYQKAFAADSTNPVNAYNAAVAAYTMFENASDAARKIRGTTAAIKAQRATADKVADAAADKALEWFEKAYTMLDAKTDKDKITKNSQTSSAKLLSVLYEYKRERSKTLKPADYDKYDAKFKFYDTKY